VLRKKRTTAPAAAAQMAVTQSTRRTVSPSKRERGEGKVRLEDREGLI
jgi:hypothetical protein